MAGPVIDISMLTPASWHAPVRSALRQHGPTDGVPISIDTFYSEVATAAVGAGADIVNDVSGGTLDPLMFTEVARLGAPYVLMHMRGDAGTMQSAENTRYRCVWHDVGASLQNSADAAMAAGIPAWNIILDPGLGFAKKAEGSVDLLRNLARLRAEALRGAMHAAPMLIGPSRKGFLGALTGRTVAKDRDAATVAACVVSAQQGADIVRVHNVPAAVDGMRVADAVYR